MVVMMLPVRLVLAPARITMLPAAGAAAALVNSAYGQRRAAASAARWWVTGQLRD